MRTDHCYVAADERMDQTSGTDHFYEMDRVCGRSQSYVDRIGGRICSDDLWCDVDKNQTNAVADPAYDEIYLETQCFLLTTESWIYACGVSASWPAL